MTAARAVQVRPIAIPIHGVWPSEPSLRAWRTCRAPNFDIIESTGSAMGTSGSRTTTFSGIDAAGERCARSGVMSRARGCDSARTAGARVRRKSAGFMMDTEWTLSSGMARGSGGAGLLSRNKQRQAMRVVVSRIELARQQRSADEGFRARSMMRIVTVFKAGDCRLCCLGLRTD